MARKILILGSAGFLGSNIVKRLYTLGHDICGVDNFWFGYKENIEFEYPFLNSNVADITDLDKYDIIVSAYCSNIIYAMKDPIGTYENNIVSGMKCFSRFKGKIIYLSTSSVYGNADIYPTKESCPMSLKGAYAISKYIMEEYLKTRGGFTILRLSNVYGYNQRPENPYCGVINKFIYNKLKNKKSKVSGGLEASRDYTFVDDVVDAVVKAINIPALNTEINIGTSTETTIAELIKLIGGDYDMVEKREIDNISRRCLDIEKSKSYLGWEPKTLLKDGIKKTTQWIKTNYAE